MPPLICPTSRLSIEMMHRRKSNRFTLLSQMKISLSSWVGSLTATSSMRVGSLRDESRLFRHSCRHRLRRWARRGSLHPKAG